MTNAKPKLTAAQRRAVDWLPADGSWGVQIVGVGRALLAFQKCAGLGCVECDGGNYGPRSGFAIRWRLTRAGIAIFHGATDDGQG